MKKYLLIDKDGNKEMDENEFSSFFYHTLFEHFYKNIEEDFKKSGKEVSFKLIGKNFKKRPQKKHTCLFNNCNSQAIYCHSISEQAVLRNIAQNSFLFKPSISKIEMEKIGISEASVFPGFCNSHDTELFLKLDDPDNKNFDNDFFSQLSLRTVTKGIYRKEREIFCCEQLIEKLNKEYCKSSDTFFQAFNTTHKSRFLFESFKCSEFSINEVNVELRKSIEKSKTILQLLQKDFLSENLGLGIIVNETIPVAFSGTCILKTNEYDVILLVNCLPYKKQTIVSINYAEYNSVAVNTFLENDWPDNSDSLLRLLELLAVRSTDNLFFNIDYWESLSKEIQKKFLYDFIDLKNSCLDVGIDYSYLKWNWNNQ